MTVAPEMTRWEGTLEELKGLVSPRALSGETVLLNMGPQHPSTHGVLRLLLEMDGETLVSIVPDIGYLHTASRRTWSPALRAVYRHDDRMDYWRLQQHLVYCLAIEI
jgi:NADH-quinone oxidoreductase subunit D